MDVSTKQFEVLNEVVPRASRFAVWSNPDNPWHPIAVSALQAVSRSRGVNLQTVKVRDPAEFDRAFDAMTTEHTQAVIVLADPMITANAKPLVEFALKHRLPMMGGLRLERDKP